MRNRLELLIDDPKSVFYRVHADRKQYHYLDVNMINQGTITRSLDMRHLNLLPTQWKMLIGEDKSFLKKLKSCYPNLNPTTLSLLQQDKFGLNTMGVNYSLSKHKRWQFADHFIKNVQTYQYPDHKISTILATSEFPFRYSYDFPNLFENPRCWSSDDAKQLNCLVASNNDGSMFVRENQKSRGFLHTFLSPLSTDINESNNQKSTKNKKSKKKQCQNMKEIEPIRIAYHITEPHISLNHLNGSKESRWNANSLTYCRKAYGPSWRRKSKLSTKNKFPPLNPNFYTTSVKLSDQQLSDDELVDEDDALNQSVRPTLLTLFDFMDEKLIEKECDKLSDMVENDFCLNDYDLLEEK